MRPQGRRLTIALITAVLLSACNNAVPPTATDAQPLMPDASQPNVPGVMGQWRRTGYAVTGSATLAIDSGSAKLTFSSDFTIAQTPGPVVYLNTTNNPNTGRPLRIGALKGRTGAQSYLFQVPPGVRYAYVIIWCDPFNVPMAEAPIPLTP